MIVSLGRLYDGWAVGLGPDYTVQGRLFEELSAAALVRLFPRWEVIPTGGTTTYSYDWDYLWICNSQSLSIRIETCGQWNQGGTDWQWSKSVSGAEFDMKIRVTVTDSNSPVYTRVEYLIVDIIDI